MYYERHCAEGVSEAPDVAIPDVRKIATPVCALARNDNN